MSGGDIILASIILGLFVDHGLVAIAKAIVRTGEIKKNL
jgi:hypothetical protein